MSVRLHREQFEELKQVLYNLNYPDSYHDYLIKNGVKSINALNAIITEKKTGHLGQIPFGRLIMIHHKLRTITKQKENIIQTIKKYRQMYFEKYQLVLSKQEQVMQTAKEVDKYIIELQQIHKKIEELHELKISNENKNNSNQMGESKSLRNNTKYHLQQESDTDCEEDIDIELMSKRTKIIREKNKNRNIDSQEIEKETETPKVPWISSVCGHIFEKEPILRYIKYKNNNGQSAKCPNPECNATLEIDLFVSENKLQSENLKRSESATKIKIEHQDETNDTLHSKDIVEAISFSE